MTDKWLLAVIFVVMATTGLATAAGWLGWGANKTTTEPTSIREASARGPSGQGPVRTRYFIMGGGHHYGK